MLFGIPVPVRPYWFSQLIYFRTLASGARRPGSNPGGPTKAFKELQILDLPKTAVWSPNAR
jgi:hypothetical protein